MTYPAPDHIAYDPWFDDKVEPSTLLKRTTKEKSMSIEYGKELIISKILPVLDDFNRAQKAGEKIAVRQRLVKMQRKPVDVPKRDFISLNIDLKQMGVGGDNSWGARTLN